MTLDGLEAVLKRRFKTHCKKGVYTSYKVHLIRYADDFVITGASKELLQNEILPIVREFLHARGLTLSEEKTKITHIGKGFDFLGYNIRKYNGKLLIKPSKESLKRFMVKIRETIYMACRGIHGFVYSSRECKSCGFLLILGLDESFLSIKSPWILLHTI